MPRCDDDDIAINPDASEVCNGVDDNCDATVDASWIWAAMTFNVDAGNNDEFTGNLEPIATGTFCYTTRYSVDGGYSWFYAVNGPDEGNPTCPGPFGVLVVNPAAP